MRSVKMKLPQHLGLWHLSKSTSAVFTLGCRCWKVKRRFSFCVSTMTRIQMWLCGAEVWAPLSSAYHSPRAVSVKGINLTAAAKQSGKVTRRVTQCLMRPWHCLCAAAFSSYAQTCLSVYKCSQFKNPHFIFNVLPSVQGYFTLRETEMMWESWEDFSVSKSHPPPAVPASFWQLISLLSEIMSSLMFWFLFRSFSDWMNVLTLDWFIATVFSIQMPQSGMQTSTM